MDNYEGAFETESPQPAESRLTKSLKQYTASIPSSPILGAAAGAVGAALVCQLVGHGRWGKFIAQCASTWLIIGLYNRLVKLEGYDDRTSPGHNRGYLGYPHIRSRFNVQSSRSEPKPEH